MGWHQSEGGLLVPDEGLYVPGDCSDTFDERLGRAGVVDGDVGQFVLAEYAGRVGVPGCADRMGWAPLDELPAGAIVLDLNDIDIAAGIAEGAGHVHPAVGPQLNITGVITAGRPTQWVDHAGRAVTMSRFASGAYLATALALDPTDAQHIYCVALYRAPAGVTAGIVGTRGAGGAGTGRGWLLRTSSAAQYGQVDGDAYRVSTSGIEVRCQWSLGSLLVVRGGNITQRHNGLVVDTDATPAGSLAGGAVLQIGAAAGAYAVGLGLVRLVLVYSPVIDAIITDTWAQRVAECVLGHRARCSLAPHTPSTYTRAGGPRTCYPAGAAGRVHVVSQNMPPAEAENGIGADGQIASVTSKNFGFIAGDGTAYLADRDAGLTISANPVDDTANLADVFPDGNGLVLAVQNPDVVARVQRLGNAIGGAPVASHASLRCRIYAGGGVPRLGWSTAGGPFTPIANVAAAYARTYGSALPAAATDKQAIEIPAGASVYLVLWHAGQGADIPDEVPSLAAAGASATVAEGVIATPHVPSTVAEGYEAELEPRFWGGAAGAAALDVVRHGADAAIGLDGAGHVISEDAGAAHTATAAVVEVDGVIETLRASHGSRGLQVQQAGQAENVATYGATNNTMTIRGRGRRRLRRLTVYRNPIWGRP